eukprot:scaffold3134_cov414-Prasinococcus_capsulatus_cf.AAC.9
MCVQRSTQDGHVPKEVIEITAVLYHLRGESEQGRSLFSYFIRNLLNSRLISNLELLYEERHQVDGGLPEHVYGPHSSPSDIGRQGCELVN